MTTHSRSTSMEKDFRFAPLTKTLWPDFESLFGERGACGGCWCMWWRLTHAEYQRSKGEKNRRAMLKTVSSGVMPGILAYQGETPVGWCAIAPREQYVRMQTSRVLRPVDDSLVWSVVCFFITRACRHRGLSPLLLKAAVKFAGEHGAKIVEGYPIDPGNRKQADAFVYPGLISTFAKAGFVEVARRSETRPIMRHIL